MLTYGTGTAGSMAAARRGADHLLTPTRSHEEFAVAASYTAMVSATTERDVTLAEPRADTHPRLANLLGIDVNRAPEREEIVNLLAGRRADGAPIPGKQLQGTANSLAVMLGLDGRRLPRGSEIDALVAGRRADGKSGREAVSASAFKQLARLYGQSGTVSKADLEHMRAGRRVDGTAMRVGSFREGLTATRTRIAYVDLVFSADKSLSAAWALAATDAERAILLEAHRTAVTLALGHVELEVGRARRGQGGRNGADQGAVAWIRFDHLTARSTSEVVRRDPQTGAPRVHRSERPGAGEPQIHTHAVLLNVVLTEDGHVGGLDLGRLNGRVAEWGGTYQAYLATGLRAFGVDVVLDVQKGAARLPAVPDPVRDAFGNRTVLGTAKAHAYAERLGLDWAQLPWARQVGFLKAGVQGDPRQAKRDDLGNRDAWREKAKALGWHPASVLDLDHPIFPKGRNERLEIAYEAGCQALIARSKMKGGLTGADIRVSAARGLIASGMEMASEIDDVTRLLIDEGIGRGREDIARVLDAARGALTSETIDRKREEGRALAVPGDYAAVVEQIADWWLSLRRARAGIPDEALTVSTPTEADARAVGAAIRQRRRQEGELGHKEHLVGAIGQDGVHHDLALAAGDRVRLRQRTNATYPDHSRGLIGAAGSILLVCEADEDGVVLRNARGHEGRVAWQTLRHKESGRIQLAYADVTAPALPQGVIGAHILAMPAGTAATRCCDTPAAGPIWSHPSVRLVTSRDAEHQEILSRWSPGAASEIGEDDIWRNIARNLLRAAPNRHARTFVDLALSVQRRAVTTLQVGLQRQEQRAVNGLAPTTSSGSMRRRHLARSLTMLLAPLQHTVTQAAEVARRLDPLAIATVVDQATVVMNSQAEALLQQRKTRHLLDRLQAITLEKAQRRRRLHERLPAALEAHVAERPMQDRTTAADISAVPAVGSAAEKGTIQDLLLRLHEGCATQALSRRRRLAHVLPSVVAALQTLTTAQTQLREERTLASLALGLRFVTGRAVSASVPAIQAALNRRTIVGLVDRLRTSNPALALRRRQVTRRLVDVLMPPSGARIDQQADVLVERVKTLLPALQVSVVSIVERQMEVFHQRTMERRQALWADKIIDGTIRRSARVPNAATWTLSAAHVSADQTTAGLSRMHASLRYGNVRTGTLKLASGEIELLAPIIHVRRFLLDVPVTSQRLFEACFVIARRESDIRSAKPQLPAPLAIEQRMDPVSEARQLIGAMSINGRLPAVVPNYQRAQAGSEAPRALFKKEFSRFFGRQHRTLGPQNGEMALRDFWLYPDTEQVGHIDTDILKSHVTPANAPVVLNALNEMRPLLEKAREITAKRRSQTRPAISKNSQRPRGMEID